MVLELIDLSLVIAVIVVFVLLFVVLVMLKRQRKSFANALKAELEKDAGPEVPYEQVSLDTLQAVIKPESEDQPQQFIEQRYKIFSKPNTQVTFNVLVDDQPVATVKPGFFSYTFNESGDHTIKATVVQHPAATVEITVSVEAIDLSKVQLGLFKSDRTYRTEVGSNDTYNLELYPDLPLKVNIYADEKYYVQVDGTDSFQCSFSEAGEHSLYAALDLDQNVYTDYVRINVVDTSSQDTGSYASHDTYGSDDSGDNY
ncbi:MAG: hypothetical protein WCP97_01720 [bacterium]